MADSKEKDTEKREASNVRSDRFYVDDPLAFEVTRAEDVEPDEDELVPFEDDDE